jgi:hypothetical protein
MGERYWITGVQLGILKHHVEWDEKGGALVLIDQIIDKQFIGNTRSVWIPEQQPHPSEVEKP